MPFRTPSEVPQAVADIWNTYVRSQFEDDYHDDLMRVFEPYVPVPARDFSWGFDTATGPSLVEAAAVDDAPANSTAAFAHAVAALGLRYNVDRLRSGGVWFHGSMRIEGVRVRFECSVFDRAAADVAIGNVRDHVSGERRAAQRQ